VPFGRFPGRAHQELLAKYTWELAAALQRPPRAADQPRPAAARRRGRPSPATAALPGAVQSVLTGTIEPNAALKLSTFGLSEFFDTDIGGYGGDAYPKGSKLLNCRARAEEKYHARIDVAATVLPGRPPTETPRRPGIAGVALHRPWPAAGPPRATLSAGRRRMWS